MKLMLLLISVLFLAGVEAVGKKQCNKECKKKYRKCRKTCREPPSPSPSLPWSPSPPPPSPSPPLVACTTRNTFTTKASLLTAVQAFNADPTTATATYGPIADWCVSAITDMSYLFYNSQNFNADISSWETSGVTNMYGMFFGASAFNQPLSFDTSSVTAMAYMFSGASAFNQPLSFDTSSVTDMGGMFYNNPSLSDANKLLIRCAWAGTPAFASAGYGSSWGPGSCA